MLMTFASGSGPSRKKPTDRRAEHTACGASLFASSRMMDSTRPRTRFTASWPDLHRRAADWTTAVMSTIT